MSKNKNLSSLFLRSKYISPNFFEEVLGCRVSLKIIEMFVLIFKLVKYLRFSQTGKGSFVLKRKVTHC